MADGDPPDRVGDGDHQYEGVLFIEDFSGGLNTLYAPNRISKTESPDTINVWNFNRALIKRYGAVQSNAITTPSAAGTAPTAKAVPVYLVDANFSGTENLYGVFQVGSGIGIPANNYVIMQSVNAATFPPTFTDLGETTGTVTTSSSSAVVTGSGTTWSTQVAAGDYFRVNSDGTEAKISSVDSNTQITLTANYNSTNAGAAYTIRPIFPSNSPDDVNISFLNSIMFINGSYGTPPSARSWNGTDMTVQSSFPSARFTLAYQNYLFTGNTSANPSRVQWSALLDATSWPANNFQDINKQDGQQIRSMFFDGQSIVILKDRSAWKLNGQVFDPANPTWTLQKIQTPGDFIYGAYNAVQWLNGTFVILGFNGLYAYDGTKIYLINDSLKWKSVFQSFTTEGLTPNVAGLPMTKRVSTIIWKGRLWIGSEVLTNLDPSPPTGTTQSNWFQCVWDENNALWDWSSYNVTPGTTPMANRGFCYWNGIFLGVDAKTNYIYKRDISSGLNDYDSTGAAQPVYGSWATKVFEFPVQQHFGLANVYYKNQTGTLTFQYRIDEGTYTSVSIDMTTGTGGTRSKSTDIMIGQVGSTIQFKCLNNNAGENFEIYGISCSRRDLKR